MPVPVLPGIISPHGASSDGSENSPTRPAPSSDAASTDSSSSDAEETLENDYTGTQETENDYGESLGLDVVMNERSALNVQETEMDCPHLRAKVGDPRFIKSYTAAVTWRARSQMQNSSAEAGSKTKRSKVNFTHQLYGFFILKV
jgi:hypothetical protein